jgi:hypothetical protein
MAINFTDKVLITNPTSYHLGRVVLGAGIVAILVGAITHFTEDFLLPASAWIAVGVLPLVIGWIVMRSGLTRN